MLTKMKTTTLDSLRVFDSFIGVDGNEYYVQGINNLEDRIEIYYNSKDGYAEDFETMSFSNPKTMIRIPK